MKELREYALRLTMALYRVSARFPEREPLRNHCREYADEILARISAWDAEKPADGIAGRIDALRNLLSVAAETGWVHSINIEVLMREYFLLRGTVEQVILLAPGEKADKNGEILEVLDVPAKEVSAPSPVRDALPARTEQEKAYPVKAAPDPYREPNPRQQKILRHIAQAKQAKISDFFPVLSGVSPKTIQRDLSELVSKNILKRQGEKRWTTYSLQHTL